MSSEPTVDQDRPTAESPARSVLQQERLLALGQMASGFAHDVNNSLTPIIGYSDFLLDPRSDLSEQSRKCIQCIRTAAADIAEMVEQVRHFYRRRGQTETLSPVDLNSLIKEVLNSTRAQWRDLPAKAGLVIQVDTQLDKRSPQILGLEKELLEAIPHLIANAVEAMPEGGTLTLTTRGPARSQRTSGAAADEVFLEISDTGVGMDEVTRQRCLEPFFSTKDARGRGLSLAVVYGAMRRHDGRIEVESAPGQGTTVRLVFQRALSATSTDEQQAPSPFVPLRILCIDDDHRISSMLKDVLSSDHHVVEIANGGAKGLKAFRQAAARGRPFHVVITDLGMPNVDGREIVRTVKQEAPDTPVILLTAWSASPDQTGELPSGVDAVLSKPPAMERLHEILAQVTLSKIGST